MRNLGVILKFDPGRIMYLIVIDKMLSRFREEMIVRPTEKFQDMIHEEVMSHVIDGKEPPEEIRTTVMNLADDMMSGREVNLRAGDYIALMNYARQKKML
ncbi:MAG: hypothetical protein PVH88_02805 [Ignavibacteria bacterium]|jgi:hypothetical protein